MAKLKVAWHTWEPGLTNGNTSASSGGTAWMKFLFEYLQQNGAEIYWVSPVGEAPEGCKTIHPDVVHLVCDIAVMPWRWKMPAYPDRDKLYYQQLKIIVNMADAGKRVIIHDQDHMISSAERMHLLDYNCEIYEPAFFPQDGAETLFFPNPYPLKSILKDQLSMFWNSDLTYIGNNYGRFQQTVFFLNGFSQKNTVHVYGNWLERNKERESPEEVRKRLPHVNFLGRLLQEKVLQQLSGAKTTIHLCKKSYSKSGFVTIRWAEAAAAGCIPYIPLEFRMPDYWKEAFGVLGMLVANSEDMNWLIENYNLVSAQAKNVQCEFVNHFMRLEPWKNVIFNKQ